MPTKYPPLWNIKDFFVIAKTKWMLCVINSVADIKSFITCNSPPAGKTTFKIICIQLGSRFIPEFGVTSESGPLHFRQTTALCPISGQRYSVPSKICNMFHMWAFFRDADKRAAAAAAFHLFSS